MQAVESDDDALQDDVVLEQSWAGIHTARHHRPKMFFRKLGLEHYRPKCWWPCSSFELDRHDRPTLTFHRLPQK